MDAPTLESLFARIRNQWRRLGTSDPYWSVLTHESYRGDHLDDATYDQFYETGREPANLVEAFETRAALTLQRGVCLELGCGVGRVTRFLASKFTRVVAVDISPGNLSYARASLKKSGIKNVDLTLIESIDALARLPEYDFLYSVIVLQHNSPPVQAFILDTLLAKVRPGGAVLFQVVTNLPGYQFIAAEHLASADAVMEIHAIPQPVVLSLLRRHGLDVQEILMDPWLGTYGSNTIFATKSVLPACHCTNGEGAD